MAETEDTQLRAAALENVKATLAARQRAEQALELRTNELARSLALVRATLESSVGGILVTDQGKITDFNEKYLQMWPVPRALVETRDHHAVLNVVAAHFANPDEFIDGVNEIYTNSPPESFHVLELKDGRTIERFTKTQMVNGREVGRVWSFRDITGHRRTEESLRRAIVAQDAIAIENARLYESERAARSAAEHMSDMKDRFLANLSHELRTPLNAVLGWAQILRRGVKDEADLKNGLEAIERSARVQSQLIGDLLDTSRITSGKVRLDVQPLTPVSFIDAALETVRPAAEAKGIRLLSILDPVPGPITGDPARLQQVMWNLLSNAIKFTPKGGQVSVSLERVNSQIEITVADSGIGIKPEFVAHVFERFQQGDLSTTKAYGGLGLGLSIVRQLVELHGGTVTASSLGQDLGAIFTLRLPVTAVRVGSFPDERLHPETWTPAMAPFEDVDLSGVRVLIVDDDQDARDLITRLLSDCGAEVRTAATAGEAMLLIDLETPDILVSDIGMPDVDGYELLKMIRRRGTDGTTKMPAVALTAFARSEDRTRALRAGFVAHVAKPVEPSELLATVAAFCSRHE